MHWTRIARLSRRSQSLVALSATIFIYTFATSIMQYNLPLFTNSLSPRYTLLGIVLGLPWIFSILTDIPIGAFADSFGKKQTMVLGLIGLGFSGVLFYFSHSLWQLFWFLVIFGAFEGFLTVAGMAAVISLSPDGKEHQFVGGYQNAAGLGYLVGPAVSGLLIGWFGIRVPFLVFAVLCLLGALFAFSALKEVGKSGATISRALDGIFRKDHMYVSELKEFFSAGRLAYFVSFSMILIGMWGEFIWALEPVLVQSIHSSPILGGLILSSFMVPIALLDYPIGRWIDKTQRRYTAMLLGILGGGIGLIAFSLVKQPVFLILLAFVVSLSYAFFYVSVNGLFDTLSNRHRRGSMAGVWQASEDIGFALGPILGGVLADVFGLSASFMIFGGLFFLAAFWVFRERRHIKLYEAASAR